MAKQVGIVTAAAAGGSVVGGAAAAIIVWILALCQIDAAEIETPLAIILSAAGATYGGYLVPPPGTGKRVADDQ